MGLTLVTPPAHEPVSLDLLKRHLRIEHDEDNALLEVYLAAARQHIDGKDGWLGRALVAQTYELTLDAFPCHEIALPIGPVLEIVSVKYDDADGVEQTVDAADYELDATGSPGWVIPVDDFSWPTAMDAVNAIRVRFIAGYGEATEDGGAPDVPAPIRAAIMLMVGDLHSQRETFTTGSASAVPMSTTVENLLTAYRFWSL